MIGKKTLQIQSVADKMRMTVKNLSHFSMSDFVHFFTEWFGWHDRAIIPILHGS